MKRILTSIITAMVLVVPATASASDFYNTTISGDQANTFRAWSSSFVTQPGCVDCTPEQTAQVPSVSNALDCWQRDTLAPGERKIIVNVPTETRFGVAIEGGRFTKSVKTGRETRVYSSRLWYRVLRTRRVWFRLGRGLQYSRGVRFVNVSSNPVTIRANC